MKKMYPKGILEDMYVNTVIYCILVSFTQRLSRDQGSFESLKVLCFNGSVSREFEIKAFFENTDPGGTLRGILISAEPPNLGEHFAYYPS